MFSYLVKKWNPRRCSLLPFRFKLKTCILLVCCCGLVLFIIEALRLYIYTSSKMCSAVESRRYLQELCSAYIQGLVTGSLCEDLCNTKRITFVKCLNYRHGKIILEMNYDRMPLILKTKSVETPEWKTLSFVLGSDAYPTLDFFKELVFRELSSLIVNAHRKILQQSSNILKDIPNTVHKISYAKNFSEKNILSEIIGFQIENNDLPGSGLNISQNQRNAALMESVWSVVQQSEYVFMKINQDWKYIPKNYGTCGKFYGMEYLVSGQSVENEFKQSDDFTVSKRIKVALQMLDMVQEMDKWQPNPLHMCDVKLENFGVSSSTARLYTIDLDMFFFNDKMVREIMSPEKCLLHTDCDFFDCKGWCDQSTGRCLTKRINNNLQAVCEKIFKNSFTNGYHGLLHSLPPPFKHQLDGLLPQCTHPPGSPDPEVAGKASKSIFNRLISLLQKAQRSLSFMQ